MARKTDFDEAACKINEQVTVIPIHDPQLVSTIQKWLAKLTSESRGANELNYLKLLQYMVADRRIGRPFVRAPPAGPLLPLSRYLNPPLPPPPCDDHRPPRAMSQMAADSWQTIGCRKTAGLKMRDSNDYEDTDDTDLGTARGESCSGATLLSTTDNDGESTDRTYTADTCSNDTASLSNLTDDQMTTVADTRLHLSGGAENTGSCWGGTLMNSKNVNAGRECGKLGDKRPAKNFPFRPCDPCIDDLGKHIKQIKKPLPGPIDAPYKDMLGDCALPKFSDDEQKSVGPELLRFLENVSDLTTLQDLYFQASLYTCDHGSLMMRMSDGMLDDFRAFISDVFESRADNISDGLAKEQMALNGKYTHLEHRTFNRATVALDYLREVMPTFNWYKYQASPSMYLKRLILRRSVADAAGDAEGSDNFDGRPASMDDGTDIIFGDGGGDDDEDNDLQQLAIKKLLYTLNWLRTEVSRVDCENHRLIDQRNGLTTSLVKLNRHLTTDQVKSSSNIEMLKNELTMLRQRSTDQSLAIDKLLETIQLAMQNKQSPPGVIC